MTSMAAAFVSTSSGCTSGPLLMSENVYGWFGSKSLPPGALIAYPPGACWTWSAAEATNGFDGAANGLATAANGFACANGFDAGAEAGPDANGFDAGGCDGE